MDKQTLPPFCPSCGSSEFMRDGKCYSAECPAYLAEPPAVPLADRMSVPAPAPGYDGDDVRCGICGEDAQAECEECGDDLCADCLALHMEDQDDE